MTDDVSMRSGTAEPATVRLAPHGVQSRVPEVPTETVFTIEGLSFFYGDHEAISDVSMTIGHHEVTAFIGPSGCGKTTFLRCLNRLNDLIPNTRAEGRIDFLGKSIFGADVKPIELRRRIGMVFQKPNPFPTSIYENVALAPRLHGTRKGLDDIVEESLRKAALWDEVKLKLKASAFSLSGGQQQRLCIARAIAMKPEVVLMDEPCAALDPIATLRIEELMVQLKSDYAILVVTHNMQQASRVSDRTAFFSVAVDEKGIRTGHMIEMGPTDIMFTTPTDKRTEDYITGRFG